MEDAVDVLRLHQLDQRAGAKTRLSWTNFFLSLSTLRSLTHSMAAVSQVLPDMLYCPWSLEGDRIEARPLSHPLAGLDVGLAWRKGAALPESLSNFLTAVRPTLNGQLAATAAHLR